MFYSKPSEIAYIDYHLRKYGATCLNYNWIERFTKDEIIHDLAELGFDCTISVNSELCPDTIYDYEYDHNRRIRVVYPILPIVTIRWKDYVKSI